MPALCNDMAVGLDASRRCMECGLCERVQNEGCGCSAGMWGPFARRSIEQARHGAMDAETERQLFTCALCGACTAECPVGIHGASVAREGRAAFHALYPLAHMRWRPMQTDKAGNVFTGIRAVRGISYDEALDPEAGPCPSLFLPGCTLCTYAPDLTRAVAAFLAETEQASGMTSLCCGNSLWGIGLSSRCDEYARKLGERLAAHGTRRIVAGCPNCHRALVERQKEGLVDASIEVAALPRVLADAGLRVDARREVAPKAQRFSVHDSCPDRETGLFGSAVRKLLEGESCVEMEHAGKHAPCCGSGGMVSFFDASACKQRRARRVEEFRACGADCLVTSCVSCAHSFLRSDPSMEIRHYLELLFDRKIDWAAQRRASSAFAAAGGYDFAREGDDEWILG